MLARRMLVLGKRGSATQEYWVNDEILTLFAVVQFPRHIVHRHRSTAVANVMAIGKRSIDVKRPDYDFVEEVAPRPHEWGRRGWGCEGLTFNTKIQDGDGQAELGLLFLPSPT